MRVSGIVLAAGRSERFGQDKVFAELQGFPILSYSLRAFSQAGVEELVVVARPGTESKVQEILRELGVAGQVVRGGARRRDSALAGVEAAHGEFVLIHDGARPLVSPELIRRVLRATEQHGAAVPVLPVVDTLRYTEEGFLKPETLPRAGLVAIQTPQGFRRDLLLSALRACNTELPDDAAALLVQGFPVATVLGDPKNLKITYPTDLDLLVSLLRPL